MQSVTNFRLNAVLVEVTFYCLLLGALYVVYSPVLPLSSHDWQVDRIFPTFTQLHWLPETFRAYSYPVVHFGILPSMLLTSPIKGLIAMINFTPETGVITRSKQVYIAFTADARMIFADIKAAYNWIRWRMIFELDTDYLTRFQEFCLGFKIFLDYLISYGYLSLTVSVLSCMHGYSMVYFFVHSFSHRPWQFLFGCLALLFIVQLQLAAVNVW